MSRIMTSCMIVVCCVVLPVAVSADEKAYAVFREGMNLESGLRIYEARDRFRDAIILDASNAGYREHYAWSLHFNGFPEEAAAAFSDALSLKPADTDLAKGKAWNLGVTGRLRESLALYNKLLPLTSSPDNIASASAEVKRLLAAADDAKIALLKERLAASPGDRESSRELFRTLAYRGQFAESLARGDSILEGAPHDLAFRLEYARVLSWSGQREKSADSYNYLMQQSPDNPFLMLELAHVLADGGRLSESLRQLERAQELMPKSARIARAMAEVLARLGRGDEAVATSDAIENAGYNGLERALARARSRHFSGLLEEAVQEYSAALALYPYHPELLQGMTECALYTGAPDMAEDAVGAWKAISPDDPRLAEFEYSMRKALAPRIAGRFQYYENSSRFKRFNTGLSAESRVGGDFSLLADASQSHFKQSGFRSVDREALAVGVRYTPVQKLEFTGRIGGNLYDRGDDPVTGAAGVTSRLYPGWQLAVAWERMDIVDTEPVFGNAIYNHVVTMGAVGSRINSNEYSIYLQRDLLAGRLALSGKAAVGDYSDGNLKQSRYAGISYRLYDVPRLTIGYNYFFLDYRDAAPAYTEGTRSTSAYYDPLNFEVHTLFLDLSHRFSKELRAGIEQRVSFIPKSDGIAYALFGSLEADLGRSVSAMLTYRFFHQDKGVDRSATSGHFSAQEALAGITVYF